MLSVTASFCIYLGIFLRLDTRYLVNVCIATSEVVYICSIFDLFMTIHVILQAQNNLQTFVIKQRLHANPFDVKQNRMI